MITLCPEVLEFAQSVQREIDLQGWPERHPDSLNQLIDPLVEDLSYAEDATEAADLLGRIGYILVVRRPF